MVGRDVRWFGFFSSTLLALLQTMLKVSDPCEGSDAIYPKGVSCAAGCSNFLDPDPISGTEAFLVFRIKGTAAVRSRAAMDHESVMRQPDEARPGELTIELTPLSIKAH